MSNTIHDIEQNERYPFAIFQVGDGATRQGYSDSQACTVIKVSPNGKRAWIQRDKATRNPDWKPEIVPGGFAGHCTNQDSQTYTYERDTEGQIYQVSLRKWRGRYVWTDAGGSPDGHQSARAGKREFYDYNF